MTWALVPPTPKALTPSARRGWPLDSHLAAVAVTLNGLFAKSKRSVGFLKFRVPGNWPLPDDVRGVNKPGDSGSDVEVADVSLGSADGAEAFCARLQAGGSGGRLFQVRRVRSGRRAA